MRSESSIEEISSRTRRLRTVVVGLTACILMAGCVTTRTVEATPEQLRQDIRSGELVEPGDRVSVVTAMIGERTFRVTEVNQDVIRGDGIEVAIDDVVALQTHKVDVGKTAAAAAGTYLGLNVVVWIAIGIALGQWSI